MTEILFRTQPFTRKEALDFTGAGSFITGIVPVDLSEIIDNDLEGFLDIISEKLVSNGLLMDISYRVVGNLGNTLYLEVSGDISQAYDLDE